MRLTFGFTFYGLHWGHQRDYWCTKSKKFIKINFIYIIFFIYKFYKIPNPIIYTICVSLYLAPSPSARWRRLYGPQWNFVDTRWYVHYPLMGIVGWQCSPPRNPAFGRAPKREKPNSLLSSSTGNPLDALFPSASPCLNTKNCRPIAPSCCLFVYFIFYHNWQFKLFFL